MLGDTGSKRAVRILLECILVVSNIVIIIFTARKRSLGQGNVFTPVCHSVHSGHRSGRYVSYRNAYLLRYLSYPRIDHFSLKYSL